MTRWIFLPLALLACKEPPPPPPVPPPEPASTRPAEIPASQPDLDVGKAEAHEPSEKQNSLSYKDPRCGGVQPCECTGTIVYGQNAIAKIGLTEDDLARGTPCLLGDFDANGTQDVAFLSKEYGTSAASVVVLLFDALGLRDTPAFPKKVTTLAIHSREGVVGLLESTTRTFFHYKDGKFEMQRI